jgi:hypothetical protein
MLQRWSFESVKRFSYCYEGDLKSANLYHLRGTTITGDAAVISNSLFTARRLKRFVLIIGWNSVLMNLSHFANLKALLGTTIFLIHPNRMV